MAIPRALRMVLTPRIISDLQTKMTFIKKVPQKKLTQYFLDSCDSGFKMIIESEQKKTPNVDQTEIMKKYYLTIKGNTKKVH